MIVEFIGCTGSGKSRLIHAVQARLAQSTRVLTEYELVARRWGLGGVANPSARNLVVELAGFPASLRALPRRRAFVRLATRLFTRDAGLSLVTIRNLLSLERKMGTYEIAVRHPGDAVILVDEGPIQAAHMFAFTRTPPTSAELARFAQLVPLPDLVVYVRAPLDTLVARALGRPDPPRQLPCRDVVRTRGYLRRAAGLFDALVQDAPLRERVLLVENPDASAPEYDRLALGLAEAVLRRNTSVRRPGGAPAISPAT